VQGTPIEIALEGALKNIKFPTMMGHAIQHAVERAGVDPGLIEVFWKGSGFDKS
jgi:acetyl-CoA C-acetyltransferase/acetyl-CoA acyltransferase